MPQSIATSTSTGYTQSAPSISIRPSRSGRGGRNLQNPEQSFSSSLLGQSFTSASARDAAEAQYRQRKAEEAKTRQERQSEIASRRLGGQISSQTSINPVSSDFQTRGNELSTRYSFGSAVKQSFKNIGNTQSIGSQGFGSYFSSIFTPFSNTNAIKRQNQIQPRYITSGTINTLPTIENTPRTELSTQQIAVAEGLRRGEDIRYITSPTQDYGKIVSSAYSSKAQNELNLQSNIIGKELQGEINAGKLTVSEADSIYSTRLNDLKLNLESDYGSRLSSTIKARSSAEKQLVYVQSSENIAPILETGAKLGISTAVLASGNIPLTSTLGAYSLARGGTDIAEAGFNKNLTLKERSFKLGTGAIEAGFGGVILRGSLGLGTTKSLISRQNVRDIQSELNTKAFKIEAESINVEGGKFLSGTGSRATLGGSGVQDIEFALPIFSRGAKEIYGTTESGTKVLLASQREGASIAGGRIRSSTRIADIFSGQTIKNTESFNLNAQASFPKVLSVGGKGTGIRVSDEALSGSIGSGILTRKSTGTISSFRFVSVAKQQGSEISTFSISPSKLGIGKNLRVGGRIDSYGTIKEFSPTLSSDSSFKSLVGGGRKTQFSQTFTKQDLSLVQGVLGGLSKQETVSFTRITTKPITRLGSSQALETRSSTRTSLISSPSLALEPRQSQLSFVSSKSALGSSSIQRNRLYYGASSGLKISSIQRQSFKGFTGQVNRYGFGLAQTSFSPTITPNVPTFGYPTSPIIPIGRGSIPYLKSFSGRSNALFGSFNPTYTPGLTATTFNLKGIVPKRFRGGIVDPFGTRYISVNRRGRRKKR